MEITGKYSISPKEEYVLVKLEDMISATIVVQASLQLLKIEGYFSGKPVIWIATTADLSTVDGESIEAGVSEIDDIYEGLPLGRIALVTERMINIWTIQFFKEMYDKEKVRVFETFMEAKEWALMTKTNT